MSVFSFFLLQLLLMTEHTGSVVVVKETADAQSAVVVVFALGKWSITRN